MAVQQESFVGKAIGDFILQERIGGGRVTSVYRAFQPKMKRDAVVKLINLNTAQQGINARERFEHDIQRLRQLDHPHILRLYDYGIADPYAYLAVALVHGGTLRTLLNQTSIPEFTVTVKIINQIAQAVGYAHLQGITHADLKPTNVLLDGDNSAYLTDFGMAQRILGDDLISSREGNIRLPIYHAPEQLTSGFVDERSLVYSLGIMLYEMVTGQLPFTLDADPMTNLNRLTNGGIPRPRTHNAAIPPLLDGVIMRALEKSPADRQQTTFELREDLDGAIRSTFTAIPVSTAPKPIDQHDIRDEVEAELRESRLQNATLWSAAVTTVVVVFAVIWLLLRAPIPAPEVVVGSVGDRVSLVPVAGAQRNTERALGEEGFIAYVGCNLANMDEAAYAQTLEADAADRYGFSVRVGYDSGGSADGAAAAIQSAVDDGARGLILCPVIHDQWLAVLDTVPVVVTKNLLPADAPVVPVVADDNQQLGTLAAEAAVRYILAERRSNARVVIINDDPGAGGIERVTAITSILAQQAPNAEIKAIYSAALLDPEELKALVIDPQPRINVVITTSDRAAFSLITLLETNQIPTARVAVFSIGGEPLARSLIDAGLYLRETVSLNYDDATAYHIDAIVSLIGGSIIPQYVYYEPGDVYPSQDGEASSS